MIQKKAPTLLRVVRVKWLCLHELTGVLEYWSVGRMRERCCQPQYVDIRSLPALSNTFDVRKVVVLGVFGANGYYPGLGL